MATEMWAMSFWIAHILKFFGFEAKDERGRRSVRTPRSLVGRQEGYPKSEKVSVTRTFNPVEATGGLAKLPALES